MFGLVKSGFLHIRFESGGGSVCLAGKNENIFGYFFCVTAGVIVLELIFIGFCWFWD